MTAKEMWKCYITENHITETEYDAWAFGDDPDYLAELVCQGKKTATSSAYPLYEAEALSLPKVKEYSVILDSQENAKCIIQTTKVSICAFHEISASHAFKEGEGDRSLSYWRCVHEAFFRKELKEAGMSFDENMKVVCEEFEVRYKEKEKRNEKIDQ